MMRKKIILNGLISIMIMTMIINTSVGATIHPIETKFNFDVRKGDRWIYYTTESSFANNSHYDGGLGYLVSESEVIDTNESVFMQLDTIQVIDSLRTKCNLTLTLRNENVTNPNLYNYTASEWGNATTKVIALNNTIESMIGDNYILPNDVFIDDIFDSNGNITDILIGMSFGEEGEDSPQNRSEVIQYFSQWFNHTMYRNENSTIVNATDYNGTVSFSYIGSGINDMEGTLLDINVTAIIGLEVRMNMFHVINYQEFSLHLEFNMTLHDTKTLMGQMIQRSSIKSNMTYESRPFIAENNIIKWLRTNYWYIVIGGVVIIGGAIVAWYVSIRSLCDKDDLLPEEVPPDWMCRKRGHPESDEE